MKELYSDRIEVDSASPRSTCSGCDDGTRRGYGRRGYGRRGYRSTVLISILCIALVELFSFSCSRTAPSTKTDKPNAGSVPTTVAASASIPTAPAPTGSLKSAAPVSQQTGKPVQQTRPRPVLAASLRAFGLGSTTGPFMPEDFSLGPLQDYRASDPASSAALQTARRFMDAFISGKIEPSLLYPEGRDALVWLLQPLLAATSSTTGSTPAGSANKTSLAASNGIPRTNQVYRLGSIVRLGDSASFRVLLSSAADPDPRALPRQGLLSLRMSGETWFVEGFVVEMPKVGSISFDPGASHRKP
jgi:hypothetical protein